MIRPRRKPRRGREKDPAYRAWLATQPCIVTGASPVTLHHVREYGSPKQDRRALPLIAHLHLIGLNSKTSIEAMGKKKWQALWGVDLEAQIIKHNEAFDGRAANGSDTVRARF